MMASQSQRYAFLDVLRGIALIAMAIYHFGWDLAFFGYVTSEAVNDGPWKYFARCIASSFLVLVGISLVLAHQNGIRWIGFWKRWIKVAGAALIITIATYFATPNAFIFFGILHQIAFASIAGLLFLRMPAPYVFILGLIVVGIGQTVNLDVLNGIYMAWTGLQSQGVVSNDYVPVFPWFGAVLLGIGARDFIKRYNVLDGRLQEKFAATALGKGFAFLGRHSLVFYLVHQPILIGLIYVFSQLFPVAADPEYMRTQFMHGCMTNTESTFGESEITNYCNCIVERFDDQGLWSELIANEQSATGEEKVVSIYAQCQADLYSQSQSQ